MYFWLTKYLMHELCFIKDGKTINIFLVPEGWCIKELGGQSICKDLFIKQIMPDKYVALGFCERDFLLPPTHGAKRHKHIDPTNSLNQPCLVGLKICSKCPCKIGDILTNKIKHKGMNCPTYWNAWMIRGTFHPWIVSSKESIVQGMLHPRDASSQRCFIQGAHSGTNDRGHIGLRRINNAPFISGCNRRGVFVLSKIVTLLVLLVLQYVLKSLYFEMSCGPRSEIYLPVSIARTRG